MFSTLRSNARLARVAQPARRFNWTTAQGLKKADVVIPDYRGMTPDLMELLKEPQPASYTPAMKRMVRPTKIGESVLDYIGNTPMINCSRLVKHLGLDCQILAKCEYYSAGGSVKDRIAFRMIREAEAAGKIKPGDTLIEPTSGNTGVGICMAGAVLGYRVIICLPKKMSGEKVNTMARLGATIIRTPTEAAWNAPDSHITLSARLQKAIPNSYVLDQYKNKGNPLAHYEGAAEEIIEQTGGDFTHIVMSAGTGGTLTGTAKKIKEKLPHVKVVGIDPVGSILAVPDSMNDHKRLQAFQFARALVRHEGMLIGGSCGSAMGGAVNFIREMKLGKDAKVVVLLPDSSRNYMSKFMADDWMEAHGFETVEKL